MKAIVTFLLAVAMLAAGRSYADRPSYSHQEYFEHYEGTATCLECHADEAEAFFHSQHYQWRGGSPDIVNAKDQRLGKLNTMNDFCTSPVPNWIGESRNSDGKVVAQGCSKCHAGLGRMPAAEVSRDQLENIDCLICHASGYRRDLHPADSGGWEWRSILWKNQVGLDSVSKRISLPTRQMCLRCHSGAGGGPNYKRGDIEYALADCEPDFDVHMATSGNDMQCVDCHAGSDHRVRGRGADLSGTDLPDQRLSCSISECHGEMPHDMAVLDHHARRIDCTVCHITEFAKSDPTDMRRDWSQPVHNAEINKYTATITKEDHVKPVYAWYNGKTRSQLMGQKIKRDENGKVGMMLPEGQRKDQRAKIHAFKLHEGVLPVLADKEWLVPIAVEEFFAGGDLDKAVHAGAIAAYGIQAPEFAWVETIRYMGIFHEVQPKQMALGCLDCHAEGGRMDWQALGYRQDPLSKHFR